MIVSSRTNEILCNDLLSRILDKNSMDSFMIVNGTS